MRLLFAVTVGLLAFLMPHAVHAQDQSATTPVIASTTHPTLAADDLNIWLDGLMPYLLQKTDVAGAVIVVVKGDQVILQRGYGYADVTKRIPVDPEKHLFRPGSVSKLFTWTAVMQLVESGKLNLDQDVNTYLDFKIPPYAGKPVTMRNLMTHTAGFEEQIRWLISNDADVEPLGDALKDWIPKRVYPPGTTAAYSNYGAALAGYIVQRVSGEPFDVYIRKHIFEPLGMNSSSFSQPLQPALMARMSNGYALASSAQPQTYEYLNLAPAGSMAATGPDMARFMIAHLQNGAYGNARILRADTAIQMHTTARDSLKPLQRMMLGFYETTANGHRAIAHAGDTQWFHSDLQLFLDDGIGIFVSTNSEGKDGAARDVRAALMDGFINRYLPPTSLPTLSPPDAATARQHASQLVGYYDNTRRSHSNFMSFLYLVGQLKIYANDDGTVSSDQLVTSSGAPKKWREIAPYVWQEINGRERLAAKLDGNGNVALFSFDDVAPFMVFQRASSWANQPFVLLIFVSSLLVLLLSVLARPIGYVIRRFYRVPRAAPIRRTRTSIATRCVSVVALVSLLGLVILEFAMISHLSLTSPGSDAYIIALRVLALVSLPIGTLLAAFNLFCAVRQRSGIWKRVRCALLLLAFLGLLWVGMSYHLMGFNAHY